MSNPNDQPSFTSMEGAEVVVLDGRSAVGPANRKRRPLVGKELEDMKEFLAKRAELAKFAEEFRKTEEYKRIMESKSKDGKDNDEVK